MKKEKSERGERKHDTKGAVAKCRARMAGYTDEDRARIQAFINNFFGCPDGVRGGR